jgi:rhodanese-related sulfurtransferase
MVIIQMRKNSILNIISFIIPVLLASGCLKDNVSPVSSFVTSDAINMLTYLESHGDVINSRSTLGAFVSAQALYSDLSGYVVLDIRDPQLFAGGHISGAISIQSSDLLAKVKSIDTAKVILVSQNGQSASYYGGLLRLDGLNNVYILKFGMAGWNSQFATQWNSINGFKPSGYQYFNAVLYNKSPYTDLPEVNLGSSGDIKTKIENRIENLLSEKFDDGVTYVDSTTSSLAIFGGDAFHQGIFSLGDSTFDSEYIICYDTAYNYILPGSRNVYSPDHPPHSVLYTYYNDLKSIYYLQTIPTNRKIVVYSLDGHQSAFATAYLKLFGYNVKSVLFGATWLYPFPGSMNYPYSN